MFRRIDAVLAVIVCAAAPATPVAAQYIYGTAPVSRAEPPAPAYQERAPFYRSWFDDDEVAPPPRRSRRVEEIPPPGMPGRITPDERDADAALPPPGFAVPPGQRMPDVAQPGTPANTNNPDAIRPPGAIGAAPAAGQPAPVSTAALPPEDQPESGELKELPLNLRRQLVDYQTKEPAGTLIVDTPNTYLYLVLGNGKAMRYGVRVGREGFTWAGTERISKMAEWPDWHPPAEMIERQPYLPRFTAGGPGNPLGARAMYLGKTVYRIHGTNQPSTIGKYVSSGCVGMLNDDVEDLYSRVQVGTRVVVLPFDKPAATAANMQGGAANPQSGPLATGSAGVSSNGPAITSSPLPPPARR
ncbi:MAG: L,D-transpeptidase [Pseudolabrys sp.]